MSSWCSRRLAPVRSGSPSGTRSIEKRPPGKFRRKRMKARRDHRVPLVPRTLEILEDAEGLSGGPDGGLIFPANRGRHSSFRHGVYSDASEAGNSGGAPRLSPVLQELGDGDKGCQLVRRGSGARSQHRGQRVVKSLRGHRPAGTEDRDDGKVGHFLLRPKLGD